MLLVICCDSLSRRAETALVASSILASAASKSSLSDMIFSLISAWPAKMRSSFSRSQWMCRFWIVIKDNERSLRSLRGRDTGLASPLAPKSNQTQCDHLLEIDQIVVVREVPFGFIERIAG